MSSPEAKQHRGNGTMATAEVASLMPKPQFQRAVATTLDKHAEVLANLCADVAMLNTNLRVLKEFQADLSVRIDELITELRKLERKVV
jgi:hypothetical protein